MSDILSRAGRQVLQLYAWSNVLVAFDYDGTLAPIVRDADKAAMRGATRRLLAKVAAVYPCIVVSGRAQADVQRFLRGIPLRQVVGNHGIEPWHAQRPLMEQVERWAPLLGRRLAGFKGLQIENKTFSIAVHYRRSRHKKEARAAILEAASALGPLRIIGGKQVLNLLPEGAPHKGVALERERDRLGCDTALYLGDDDTDEDVFGMERPGRLLTVRVGARRASQASYHVKNQAAVDVLLETLVLLRQESYLAVAARR
jgi:trehalose 6-phosphate phosphatase